MIVRLRLHEDVALDVGAMIRQNLKKGIIREKKVLNRKGLLIHKHGLRGEGMGGKLVDAPVNMIMSVRPDRGEDLWYGPQFTSVDVKYPDLSRSKFFNLPRHKTKEDMVADIGLLILPTDVSPLEGEVAGWISRSDFLAKAAPPHFDPGCFGVHRDDMNDPATLPNLPPGDPSARDMMVKLTWDTDVFDAASIPAPQNLKEAVEQMEWGYEELVKYYRETRHVQ